MPKKILIVDDDPVVRLLVQEFLSGDGYEVNVLDDSTKCMTEIAKQLPDLLLIDLIMPEMTGIELLQVIRNNPSTARLPVVMMSSDVDTEMVVQSYSVDADLYLQKPFGMKEIVCAVELVLGQRKGKG